MVPYAGMPLKSTQQVFWKLRVWNRDGKPGEWSQPATGSMGLLADEDWQAKWIGADLTGEAMPVFRKSFETRRNVSRAMIHVCGLGQFELSINGKKISEDFLQPGWTNYRKTRLYCSYDVTRQMQAGENVIGVMLGNGMYNVVGGKRYTKFKGSFGQPMMIAQLHLTFEDGSGQIIASDESWESTAGPITFSCIYGGEDYDARMEQKGWNEPKSDDSGWKTSVARNVTDVELRGASRSAAPIRIAKTFSPVQITHPKPGVSVYDMAQNCSMIPRITVRGKAGATVKLIPGELLKDGLVSQKSSGGPVYFMYTLKGGADETWSPRFTYYGARYLQTESTDAEVIDVKSLFICSTMPPAGTFECSNELFNKTRTLIDWAIRSNAMSVLSDCPHREKLGWLEQAHLMGPAIMYSYQLPKFLTKISGDMSDAQRPDGLVPDIAPEYTVFTEGFVDSPEWGSACILVPWQAYRWYGDRAILERHYPMMQRYLSYLGTKATDHILSHGLGDWYDLGPKPPSLAQLTPIALTATAVYYQDADVMRQIAAMLGKSGDAARYDLLASEIRASFLKTFHDTKAKRIGTASQTSMAMPVAVGLIPEADVPAVIDNLANEIRDTDFKLTAGDVGYQYVLRALADNGRSDVIFDMNARSDRPGYGYILAKGATALTEAWSARDGSSHNHFMLGHLLGWFYNGLLGISQETDSVAFGKIIIRPSVVGDVTWAKGSYQSVRGMIRCEWNKSEASFDLSIAIPPNATARVFIPAKQAAMITEAGKALEAAPDIRLVARNESHAEVEVDSGTYRFEVR